MARFARGRREGLITAAEMAAVIKVGNIPLNAHAQIQLETGTPLVAPVTITFPSGV